MKQHRKLGPVLATIVVAGNMIGSGIFLLPATLAGVGSLTLIGWLAASLGAVALALLYGKLARRQPMAVGPASYVFDAFGPFAGMQVSLWYWTSCLIREIGYARPDARREMRVSRYLNWRINRQVNAEDTVLIQRVQDGMASGSYAQGPLAAGEVALRSFGRRLRALIPECREAHPPAAGWSHRTQ